MRKIVTQNLILKEKDPVVIICILLIGNVNYFKRERMTHDSSQNSHLRKSTDKVGRKVRPGMKALT